jgi:membrane fusion protein (multidrug efflux system)
MTKAGIAVLGAILVVAAAAGGYWYGQARGPATAPTAAAPGGAPGTAPAGPGGAKGGAPGAGGAQAGAGSPVVEAARVALVSMPQSITAVGSLRSDESVIVRPEIAGRIVGIDFTEGQGVARGQTLIRLDSSVVQAEVEQTRTNLWLAESKLKRANELQQKGFISGQAREDAEATMRVARAALDLSEARLAKTVIKAPFAGVVGLRQVSIGDYVKEGADIVNLETIDPLKVDFRVPEVYLKQVGVGQSLQLSLDAIPGRSYPGRVYAINPLIDAAGRSLVIRAQIRNSDLKLRPGMFARVRLLTSEAKESLAVPEQALVPQGDEQYVYKVVDGRAQRVKVEIGQRLEARVEILAGLGKDDVVITAGQLKVRDGVPVRVAGSGGAGEPGRGAAVAGAPKGASEPPGGPGRGKGDAGGKPAGGGAREPAARSNAAQKGTPSS